MHPRLLLQSFAFALALVALPTAARALPEDPGPFEVETWDPAKNPIAAKPPIPTYVVHPKTPCAPGAVVALVHGAGESGAYKVKIANLLASRGLVAVVPSFPSLLLSPTAADGDTVAAVLAWAVAASDDPTSPIGGKIDKAVRGVAGHSNGGIVSFAAVKDPNVLAFLGWDAVAGLPQSSGFHCPSLYLESQGKECGGGSHVGYDGAPPPKAIATVTDSSHCDYDDPVSPFCVPVCKATPWSANAAKYIERYSVAWLVCLLGHDPSMQAYVNVVGGEGLSGASASGTVTCQPAIDGCAAGSAGSSGTAGSGGADTGGSAGAGTGAGAGGATGGAIGAGAMAGTANGATPSGTTDKSGCGCRVGGATGETARFSLVGVLATLVTLARCRKRTGARLT